MGCSFEFATSRMLLTLLQQRQRASSYLLDRWLDACGRLFAAAATAAAAAVASV
jgi:hypothetical protein